MHKALLFNGFSVVQSDQYAIAHDSYREGNHYTLLWHKEDEWLNVKECLGARYRIPRLVV